MMRIRLYLIVLGVMEVSGAPGAPEPKANMAKWTTHEYIAIHQYPVEKHSVVTSDGYILTMYRIPNSSKNNKKPNKKGKGKPVAFLMHGMATSSDCWVLMGPDNGLPFMMVDDGYDVWMGNARGNRYSDQHVELTKNNREFWRFSWHQIGTIDVPCMIDYILNLTKQSALHYVGHSQGTTVFLVMLSLRPEYNSKIKTSHLLAPVAFIKQIKSVFHIFVTHILGYLSDGDLLRHNEMLSYLTSAACSIQTTICHFFLFRVFGITSLHINKTVLPMVLASLPGGVSVRQMLHFMQISRSQRFRLFDFGYFKNLIEYRRFEPPDYKLENVNTAVPIHLYFSDSDHWTGMREAEALKLKVPKVTFHYLDIKDFSHIDFLFRIDVKAVINRVVLRNSNKYEESAGKKPGG